MSGSSPEQPARLPGRTGLRNAGHAGKRTSQELYRTRVIARASARAHSLLRPRQCRWHNVPKCNVRTAPRMRVICDSKPFHQTNQRAQTSTHAPNAPTNRRRAERNIKRVLPFQNLSRLYRYRYTNYLGNKTLLPSNWSWGGVQQYKKKRPDRSALAACSLPVSGTEINPTSANYPVIDIW